MRGDLDRGRFAEVIDVRLEGEAEAGDDGVLARGGADLGDDVMWLGVIDLASGAHEASFGRSGVDDEPRVDRDAVSADTRAGLEDLHARVSVRQADELPDVDRELVADQRELVGEGDVDVAVGVLGELSQFGRAGVGQEDLRRAERRVEVAGLLGSGRRQPAADAIIGDQLLEHLAGQDALRAMRVEQAVDLAAAFRKFGFEPALHLLGRADRRRGFEDDQIAGGDKWGDRTGSSLDKRKIGDAGAVR